MHAHEHGTHGGWRAYAFRDGPWQDRVAASDEPLDGRDEYQAEELLAELMDAARTAVECAIGPLMAFAEGLPDTMGPEFDRWRGQRGRRRHGAAR